MVVIRAVLVNLGKMERVLEGKSWRVRVGKGSVVDV